MKKYVKTLKAEGKGCTPKGCLLWASIDPTYLTAEEFKEKAIEINEREDLDKTTFFGRNFWVKVLHSFQSNGEEGRFELRVIDSDKDGVFVERFLYLKDKSIDEKVENELAGYDAFQHVNKAFKEKTGLALRTVFSGEKETYKDIKPCVPVQISYFNEKSAQKVEKHVFKADVSSAFPSSIVGHSLPTMRNAKREKGRIEPTEERPFAFYVKSHHLKIFNEFDTREHNSRFYEKYYNEKYNDEIKDEEEETILLERAPEESEKALGEIFKELYETRKENEENKFFMNATIGFFQLNKNPTLSALAAVIIARTNDKMLKRCYNLRAHGQKVLLVATDSIAWQGTEDEIATEEKYLGSFTYENKDALFFGTGPKRYQVKDGEKIITKCAGLKKEEKEKLDFGFIPTEEEKPSFIYYETGETSRGIKYPEQLDEETSKLIETLGGVI